mgnify:CR=1 FL=1
MKKDVYISEDIKYIGVDDKDIDLFEGQYVVPNGISYNSYLIKDSKIAVMDTVDRRKTTEWLANLENELDGAVPDYLVVSHMEPDHSYNIDVLAKKYPDMKIVGNDKIFTYMEQFFYIEDLDSRKVVVKEGDELNLGKHILKFFMAPMVHWPEVMVSYETTEKIVFAADGFGKFGALDTDEEWACEARRYYFNIVGKYGAQVQMLLKKLATLDVNMICPLHGPILKEDLGYYIGKYDTWSKYEAEDDGVFIAYSSVYGNTKEAVEELVKLLEEKGAKKVAVADLARDDFAEAIEDAFRYDKVVLASVTYNGTAFPDMENFLRQLAGKNYQNKKVGFIENGTWAPMAAKSMKDIVSTMKNITMCENTVSIKSRLNDVSRASLDALATEILN